MKIIIVATISAYLDFTYFISWTMKRKPMSGRYARCSIKIDTDDGSSVYKDGARKRNPHAVPNITNEIRRIPVKTPRIKRISVTMPYQSEESWSVGSAERLKGKSIFPRYRRNALLFAIINLAILVNGNEPVPPATVRHRINQVRKTKIQTPTSRAMFLYLIFF